MQKKDLKEIAKRVVDRHLDSLSMKELDKLALKEISKYAGAKIISEAEKETIREYADNIIERLRTHHIWS